MTAVRELLTQIPDPNLSLNERVRLRCQLAKQLEKTGNYEAARGALDDLWPDFGHYPKLDMLDDATAAEVLLRIGVLTGWIGSIKLIKGSQQLARNLIGESIAIFESLPAPKKIAEAQIEAALCCSREGALDAARALYVEALSQLDDRDGDLKALGILRLAMVEMLMNRLRTSFDILNTGAELFEASTSHVLRGAFHNEFARVLRNLGAGTNRPEYIEQSLREYQTSIFHFERAGHSRYQGCVENNFSILFLQLNRFEEAHEHLDRAQAIFTRLGDAYHLASLDDSRARVLVAEGAAAKAEQFASNAIATFEKGDHYSKLAEALTTHGVALARLNRREEARNDFERAMSTAEQIEDLQSAGLAALAFIEELADLMSDDELCAVMDHARINLQDTQDPLVLNRLSKCACRVLSIIHTSRPDWSTFSLTETLRRHEGRFIQMALEDAGGSVTKAASLLGLPGHQSLNFILQNRHRDLMNARTPIKPRRRRLFKLVNPQQLEDTSKE
jgi:tetratricopeptide (TPR) repeat protein